MRIFSVFAIGITSLCVIAPAIAQVQPQSRSLTVQEQNFVNILNEVTESSNNPLMNLVSDRVKADDGLVVCAALDSGYSPESIQRRATARAHSQFTDFNDQKNFIEYFNGIFIVAPATLCPQHQSNVQSYIDSLQRR